MWVKVSRLLILLMTLLSFGVNSVVGKTKAPDFTLVDIDGKTFSLSNFPAKVVLIDFFATWCGPCKDAIPTLKSLYSEYSREQLEIISISSEDESTLRSFVQRPDINIPWIVARDTTGVSEVYGVAYIPRTFLVDTDGYIRYDHTGWNGAGDELELRSNISSLLSEPNNGDSNGDSGTVPPGPPYEFIAIIGGAVIIFLIIGIVVTGQKLGWSKPSKKRRRPKR